MASFLSKMFETLPEELLHQIMVMCHSIDYDVFANRSPEPLLAHRNEMARLLLVCHRWRRVATPLKYETVIVTSKAEASILASILSQRRVGSYVKKLRIEGGFGQALRTILSQVPRLVYLSVSLDITSEGKVLVYVLVLSSSILDISSFAIGASSGIKEFVLLLILWLHAWKLPGRIW